MASDRARISFDPSRDYRAVVAQQGRVTLEADVNEAAWMASEALRLETIDIVGPAGTPDNGYEVAISSDGAEFVVGPGIMYAGGWRMQLPKEVELNDQPDWFDQPPPPPLAEGASPTSLLALLAIEQSVTAVEDQALREVALGGPDTSARMRLMQHFIEVPTPDTTCAAAAADLTKELAAMGLIFHPRTLEITYDAALKVSFNPPPGPSDPCCPPAQGGYLGADNQLVRVTVTSFDPATRSGTLLWGWNNASFLYRASLVDASASPQILALSPAPIDMEHTPQPTQVIEVLRTTCVLSNPADKNYIAALQGEVMALGSGTVFSNNQLTLPGTLPTTYTSDTNPLFVRLWQAEVPFNEGKPAPLDTVSGLAVSIWMKALPTAPFDARPFWHFAVRPNTPQQVYPQRYLEDRQGPDGPRQWLCDLALVQDVPGPNGEPELKLLADCRIKFLPLTQLDTCICCNLVLDPSEDWLGKLNAALQDQNIAAISVCFQPGLFNVTSKITFSGKVVKIIGAGMGTRIVGAGLEAVLEFDNCSSVTLSDILVEAGTAGYIASTGTQNLQGAVTIRDCNEIDIERVWLKCAAADLRSASCLYIYTTLAAAGSTQLENNVRVLNSQFEVGHSQAGILLVNAGRAQVEGNVIVTPLDSLNIGRKTLGDHPMLASRLAKLLVNGMTLIDTAAPAMKAQRKLLKKQAKAAAKASSKRSAKPAAPPPAEPATPATEPPKPEAEVKSASVSAPTGTASKVVAPTNLGAIGRARVTAAFGSVTLQFVSDEMLTNAWSNALKASALNENSTIRQVHDTIKGIALAAVKGQANVEHAFTDYLDQILPELYSTSSQGIVVGGNIASDIRIMNNTISGTTQGIHIGLSDRKANPAVSHLQATQVQICGNTINVRLMAASTGDRHGIYLGGVTSALISDNIVTLSRVGRAGYSISAIEVFGLLGPRVLIERNYMAGFLEKVDNGIYVRTPASDAPKIHLWKAADNYSSTNNILPGFIAVDNYLP